MTACSPGANSNAISATARPPRSATGTQEIAVEAVPVIDAVREMRMMSQSEPGYARARITVQDKGVGVVSAPDAGSTFLVDLPAA
jgi:hypothetical protein